MVDYIDLLELCKRTDDKVLSNISIHGLLREEIEGTGLLSPNVRVEDNLACHRFDIFAVTVDKKYRGYLSKFGLDAPLGIYLAKGSISIYIDKSKFLPLDDWYTVDGKFRLSKRGYFGGVAGVYNFSKTSSGWSIGETHIHDFSDDVYFNSSDRVKEYLTKSVCAGYIIHPDFMEDIAECRCDKFSPALDNLSCSSILTA